MAIGCKLLADYTQFMPIEASSVHPGLRLQSAEQSHLQQHGSPGAVEAVDEADLPAVEGLLEGVENPLAAEARGHPSGEASGVEEAPSHPG